MSDTEVGDTSAQQKEEVSNGIGDVKTDDIEKGLENVSIAEDQAATVAVPVKPKYRHDWYQTEADVYINILIKKLKKENVHVQFEGDSVSVSIEIDENNSYSLNLNLAHPVVPQKCITKVLGSKVELKMRKMEGMRWSSLERSVDSPSGDTLVKQHMAQPVVATGNKKKVEENVNKYPSSSHYTRDWDKLAAEVKKEEAETKPEGDAALNSLFQQIYRDGGDEVKKAMNKSFVESGGTVLSTNWKDIGEKKVERKPPDGMEWREYEK